MACAVASYRLRCQRGKSRLPSAETSVWDRSNMADLGEARRSTCRQVVCFTGLSMRRVIALSSVFTNRSAAAFSDSVDSVVNLAGITCRQNIATPHVYEIIRWFVTACPERAVFPGTWGLAILLLVLVIGLFLGGGDGCADALSRFHPRSPSISGRDVTSDANAFGTDGVGTFTGPVTVPARKCGRQIMPVVRIKRLS
jgi:hypothetical protein